MNSPDSINVPWSIVSLGIAVLLVSFGLRCAHLTGKPRIGFLAMIILVGVPIIISGTFMGLRVRSDCAHLEATYKRCVLATPGGAVVPSAEADLLLRTIQAEVGQRFFRAQLLIIATLTLLVPILITAWNGFNRDFLDELRYLETTAPGISPRTLLPAIVHGAREELRTILTMGRILQPFVYPTFVFVACPLALTLFFDRPLFTAGLDGSLLALQVAQVCFFLSLADVYIFLALFLLHLFLVQSVLTRLRSEASVFV